MRNTVYSSKSPPILINGKEIRVITSPKRPQSVYSSCFNSTTHETPKINQSLLLHQQIQIPQRFSLQKNFSIAINQQSPITNRKITINYSPSIQQKQMPFKSLQQPQTQQITQPQANNKIQLDTTRNLGIDVIKGSEGQTGRFRNRQSLRPSSKPRFLNEFSNKTINQNELSKYLPVKSCIHDKKPFLIEGSFQIQRSFLFSVDRQVKSFEVLDSPTSSKKISKNELLNQHLKLPHLSINNQSLTINHSQNNQQASHRQTEVKFFPIKQKNKTSFDNQIPPQEQQNTQTAQLNVNKVFGVRKINSLFNPDCDINAEQYESGSFDFSNSNANHFEGYATQIKPKRKRKFTVYSKHYSQSQQQLQNYDFCTYLQSELDHNKTNSSFSLQEADPLYQRQRQIMISYLGSLHKDRKKGSQSQNSRKLFSHRKDQVNETSQSTIFIDFVNNLFQLEEEKYSLEQMSQKIYGNAFIESHQINVHFHQSKEHPQTARHHQSHLIRIQHPDNHIAHHRHHSHHLPFLHDHNSFLHNLHFNQKPKIHHLVNIGQNADEIKENKMIIHVISIWLKEMGYLKEENKLKVIQNIKRLFLNAFQSIKQDEMLLDDNTASQNRHPQHTCQTAPHLLHRNKDSDQFHGQKRKFLHNYNSGSKLDCNNSFLQHQATHGSTPSHLNRISQQTDERSVSIQATISSIYASMYHKLLPVELQLLVLFHVCKRGWKFFQFLTVKVLKVICSHENHHIKKSSNPFQCKKSPHSLDKKLQKLVRKMVDD